MRCCLLVKMYYVLFVTFVALFQVQVYSQKIEDKISEYFDSSTVKEFYDTWQKNRKSFETAVGRNLKESYGSSGTFGVYVQNDRNPLELASGYFFTDNRVYVLLLNLVMQEYPGVLMPDVSFPLAHNVIRLETPLTKIMLDAEYILARNKSDTVFEETYPGANRDSPFVLQQVQKFGQLTIIAENCHLIGEAVVTLTGITPHVGHSNFRLVNCKFNIEIYQPGLPSPPVMAPYFSLEQGADLQRLMANALSNEMVAKLEGAIVSICNNSDIFGSDMVKFRRRQRKILNETSEYMSLVARYLNKAIIQENQGIANLDGVEFMWDDYYFRNIHKSSPSYFKITKATINGLDTAYASKKGGPIKMSGTMIAEEIRFYRLQIRGKMYYENETTKGVYDFAVEVVDVPVAVKVVLDGKDYTGKDRFLVKPWRDMDFSIIELDLYINERVTAASMLTGYLTAEVPRAISTYLSKVFDDAVKRAEETDDRQNYRLKVKKNQV